MVSHKNNHKNFTHQKCNPFGLLKQWIPSRAERYGCYAFCFSSGKLQKHNNTVCNLWRRVFKIFCRVWM